MDHEFKCKRHHFKTYQKKHRRKFQIDNIKIKTFNLPKYTIWNEKTGHQQEDIYNAYTQ